MPTVSSTLLYKYRALNANSWRVLENEELYFAAPDNLNDPLDCQLPVLPLLDRVIANEETGPVKDVLLGLRALTVTNRATGMVEPLHDSFQALSRTTGVLSLSRNPTDALLWSHYADGHRGVCIGFAASYFDDLRSNWSQLQLLGASDVYYVESPLHAFRDLWLLKVASVIAVRNKPACEREAAIPEFRESYIRDMIITALTTKAKEWSYEYEYRVVKAEPGVVYFPPNALSEIVFGLKTSEVDKDRVTKGLSGDEWKHVRFLRTQVTDGSFALQLVDL